MMRSGHKCLFLFFVAVMCVAIAAPSLAGFSVTKRLYIDGAFMGSNTVQALTYTYDRVTLASEGNRWSMYNVLDGALDEFAIYEGVLSLDDVNDHYLAAQVDEPNYTAEVASDNPLIYFRLNDPNSDSNAPVYPDASSAVMRNGTYISDSNIIMQVAGVFGTDKAAKFGGDSNAGCIDLWDGDGSFSHNNVSIEVWVKSTHLDDNYPRLFQHNGDWQIETAYGAMTDADVNGVMQVGVIGGGTTDFFATTPDINDGAWHHVVVTYEGIFEPNGYPNEVIADNPSIYFRFEEEIAEDVNVVNYGSLAVEANYVGADPYFAPGKVGKGVYLHGVPNSETVVIFSPGYDGTGDDYSHSYALTPADISVEVWFRSDPYDSYQEGGELGWARLFSNNGTWSNSESSRVMVTYSSYGIFAGVEGIAEVEAAMWAQHPGFDENADPCQETGVADGDWHHAVATFDVNDSSPNSPPIVMQFYLDGALLNTRTQEPNESLNITGILGPEFREFLIGAEATSAGRYNCLKGTVDEFALYSYILPQERVLIHYLEGMAAKPWTPETCEQIYKFGWNKPADKSGNCRIGFEDMKDMGIDWWRCIEPSDGRCEKPWLL